MYNPHDTICAIATPPGESALAIVRVSGKLSLPIVEKMLTCGKPVDHKATYSHIVNPGGEIIDEVIAVYYKSPNSFTGEDLVEITCHGGYVVSNQVLTLMRGHGARLAEPGEFTVRAFLNGRIDLTEAEAVQSVISARTEKSKSLALGNLEGRLSGKLKTISESLIELITILEAEIDFGDEEVSKLETEETLAKIENILINIEDVISTYDIGRVSEGRAQVAIVGAPNVGKSSLFNAILKNTRAIVTDTPGTTRDYLSEYVNIDGYPVILTDTAGIRSSEEEIERIGISRSLEMINDSDLCLYMLDCSRDINEDDRRIKAQLGKKSTIAVINKIDISENAKVQEYAQVGVGNVLHISARTGKGINSVLEQVKRRLINAKTDISGGVLLSQRQHNCALEAKKALESAKTIVSSGEPEEIYIGEIREALDQIGIITGRITSEDILNRIFSSFCIGK